MRITTRALFTGRLGRIVLAALFSLFVVGASLGHERSARAASSITVRISVDNWVLQEIPMKKLAAEYTRLHPGVNIEIDTALDKWDTKALAEIKQSGHPLWDAHMVTTPFADLDAHLAEGLFLPFDPYLAASPEKGARELKSAMIPTLLADSSRHGRLYSIPYSFEIVGLEWRPDLTAQAGIHTPPRTWAELEAMIPKLAAHLRGRRAYALTTNGSLHTMQEAFIMSATKHPFTKDGLIDWMSPQAQQALVFMKKLSTMKGVGPQLNFGADQLWTAGFVDLYIGQDSRTGWIKKLLGPDAAAFAPMPERCVGCGSGQVFWGNGISLLHGALHPQAATNFIVWAFGPADSAGTGLATLKSGKTPVYSYWIDKVRHDSAFAQYRWMLPMFDLINHSIPQPATPYWSLEDTVAQTWWKKYMTTDMTAREYAQHVIHDVQAAIKRAKV
jgi:ABC-type glycerol-3-phosphate transport system substrate-binding protein